MYVVLWCTGAFCCENDSCKYFKDTEYVDRNIGSSGFKQDWSRASNYRCYHCPAPATVSDCKGVRVCYVGESSALVYMTQHSHPHCRQQRCPTKRTAASDQLLEDASMVASATANRRHTQLTTQYMTDCLNKALDGSDEVSLTKFAELDLIAEKLECAPHVREKGNGGMSTSEQAIADCRYVEELRKKLVQRPGGAGFILVQEGAAEDVLARDLAEPRHPEENRFMVVHQAVSELKDFKDLQVGGRLHEHCNFCMDVDYKVCTGYMTMYLTGYDIMKEKLVTFGEPAQPYDASHACPSCPVCALRGASNVRQALPRSPSTCRSRERRPPRPRTLHIRLACVRIRSGPRTFRPCYHPCRHSSTPPCVGTVYVYMHGKKEAQVRSSTIYKIFTALRDRLKAIHDIDHLSMRKFTNDGELALWAGKYWLLDNNHSTGSGELFYCMKPSDDGQSYFCSWNEKLHQHEACYIGDIAHVTCELRGWVHRITDLEAKKEANRLLRSLLKVTKPELVIPICKEIQAIVTKHLGDNLASTCGKFVGTIIKYARRFIPACMASHSLQYHLRISWVESRNSQVQHRGGKHLRFQRAILTLISLHMMTSIAHPKRVNEASSQRRRNKRHRTHPCQEQHDNIAASASVTAGFKEYGSVVITDEQSTARTSTQHPVAGPIPDNTYQTLPPYHKMPRARGQGDIRLNLRGVRISQRGCRGEPHDVHHRNVDFFQQHVSMIHFGGDSIFGSELSWCRVICVCIVAPDGTTASALVRIGRGCSCSCDWFAQHGYQEGEDCRHIFLAKVMYFEAYCDVTCAKRRVLPGGRLVNAVTNFYLSPKEVDIMMGPITPNQTRLLGAWTHTDACNRMVASLGHSMQQEVDREVSRIVAQNTHVVQYVRGAGVTCIPICTGPSRQPHGRGATSDESFRLTFINLQLRPHLRKWVDEATALTWPGFTVKDALLDTKRGWEHMPRFQQEGPACSDTTSMQEWSVSRCGGNNTARCSGCTNDTVAAPGARCEGGGAGRRWLKLGELTVTCIGH